MTESGRPPRILLIVGGGIAAYKACELVRLIRRHGGAVTCVLTEGGSHFVTAMTLAALSENVVHTSLWDLKNEVEMGHIQLSRAADLVVVCPATADLMAKMAAGIADDLATTLLLATDKPVMVVPAMNVRMWQHAATRRNVDWLIESGVAVMEPGEGSMACGEYGPGRLPEPPEIWAGIEAMLAGTGLGDRRVGTPDRRGSGRAAGGRRASDQAVEATPSDEDPDGNEPGEEDDGFAGLSDGLITRSLPVRVPVDEEVEQAVLAIETGFEAPEEMAIPFAPGGPLLAKKGRAKAAPPTDMGALNHLVSDMAAAPEPASAVSLAPEPAEPGPLAGRHVLVTAGPTHEPIDPVRYIANRSSGKQGFAIAAAAARAGARVTLVAGPVHLPTPAGVTRVDVETARDMADAVRRALPADVAVMVAAVADWRTKDTSGEKIKKRGHAPPALLLTENPDILASVAVGPLRPHLLIGFAAETEHVLAHAKEKRTRKMVDWIVANDVSGAPARERDGRRSQQGPHRQRQRRRHPARHAQGRGRRGPGREDRPCIRLTPFPFASAGSNTVPTCRCPLTPPKARRGWTWSRPRTW
jgi:phosphopantothenoylcysteine decarboxylase/phosphopantothenate--cysteine ligase